MDLLALARGPLLQWSTAILIAGTLWRLIGIALLRDSKQLSEARHRDAWKGLRLLATRSVPIKEFARTTVFVEVTGWVFHVAFFAALVFYLPHILFFEDVFKGLIGVNFSDVAYFPWPHLPGDVVYFCGAISIAGLVVVLVHRLMHPVLRLISTFDDYASWLVTFAPVFTGMLAYSHIGAPYETLLAVHILSVEALMIWFPFGKLMHTFTMFVLRGITGMRFERKGAAL
jgi:nitrate reductase gamma subunit